MQTGGKLWAGLPCAHRSETEGENRAWACHAGSGEEQVLGACHAKTLLASSLVAGLYSVSRQLSYVLLPAGRWLTHEQLRLPGAPGQEQLLLPDASFPVKVGGDVVVFLASQL